MKAISYGAAIAMSILLTGCPTRSLFPLFSEKDVKFKPELIGTWSLEQDGSTLSFEKSSEKSYTVVFKDKKEEVYHVQMGRLGKFWFLDSSPAKDESDYHMIPTHIISKIKLDGDTLQISFLESDRLRDLIDAHKLNVAHVHRNNEIILTASTGELQDLVLRLADDEEAFPKPDSFVRVK